MLFEFSIHCVHNHLTKTVGTIQIMYEKVVLFHQSDGFSIYYQKLMQGLLSKTLYLVNVPIKK